MRKIYYLGYWIFLVGVTITHIELQNQLRSVENDIAELKKIKK